MFQKGIISATGSVATEQPQPRRATFGGPLGTRRKNSHIDVWESHCKGGTRWSYVHYALTFTIMFGRLWSSSNKMVKTKFGRPKQLLSAVCHGQYLLMSLCIFLLFGRLWSPSKVKTCIVDSNKKWLKCALWESKATINGLLSAVRHGWYLLMSLCIYLFGRLWRSSNKNG